MFKKVINGYDKETLYYVYMLCLPNGTPFYIGKGKNMRMFDHITHFINNSKMNKYMREIIECIKPEPPIMSIYKGNLTSEKTIELERSLIAEYGRFIDGGILINLSSGGVTDIQEQCSIGGKLGGRTTKDSGKGIFSEDYDTGKQSKKNWENGLITMDFVENGKRGGKFSKENKLGIFDESLQHMRTVWAKIGADALEKSGNRKGCATKEWIENNKEQQLINASKGGKLGGKTTGSMLWWNNGVINKKTFTKSEGNWIRGMLMSEKKRNNLFGRKKEVLA